MSQPLLIESSEKAKQRVQHRNLQPDSARPFQGASDHFLQLQQTLGNQRVAQLIQTRRITPEGKIVGLQPKLMVGAADDQYEQEADRIARQVVSMPDSVAKVSLQQAAQVEGEAGQPHTLQSKPLPLAAAITPFVQRQVENNEKPKDEEAPVQAKSLTEAYGGPLRRRSAAEAEETKSIQTKSAASLSDSVEAGDDVESRLSQSKGQGSPLSDHVRSYMEPRFGLDFSHVRVHTNSEAIQLNRDVGANAFTHGSDIYYGAGQNPGNLELTAHELTHVVQQTGSVPIQRKAHGSAINRSEISIQRSDHPAEDDAEDAIRDETTPCSEIIRHIENLIEELAGRFSDLDKYNGGDPGHRQRVQIVQGILRQLITLAIIKCTNGEYDAELDEEAKKWRDKPLPRQAQESETSEGEPVWNTLRRYLPEILIGALIAAGAIAAGMAIAACFASGACEIGLVLAGLGVVLATGIGAALRAAGVEDTSA